VLKRGEYYLSGQREEGKVEDPARPGPEASRRRRIEGKRGGRELKKRRRGAKRKGELGASERKIKRAGVKGKGDRLENRCINYEGAVYTCSSKNGCDIWGGGEDDQRARARERKSFLIINGHGDQDVHVHWYGEGSTRPLPRNNRRKGTKGEMRKRGGKRGKDRPRNLESIRKRKALRRTH